MKLSRLTIPRAAAPMILFRLAMPLLSPAATPPDYPCTPAARPDDNGRFIRLHSAFLERAVAGPADLLFLGDSITFNWSTVPQLWDKYYGDHRPANFGIPGDRTSQILWRIAHGELDNISPKAVVLLIGTNNLYAHDAPDITDGIKLIVRQVRAKLPSARILLLGIFPRGPRPAPGDGWDDAVEHTRRIRIINNNLAALDQGPGGAVRFLDIGGAFLDGDGKIPVEIMPDQLHLSPKGYALWADAMHPLLMEMLGANTTNTAKNANATTIAASAAPSKLVTNLRAGKKQTIVAFGTSLTAGGKWLALLKERLDCDFPKQVTVFNGAGNGRNSRWGLETLHPNVLAHKPDTVLIEFAINDAVARFNLSPDESRRNMTAIIDRIRRALPDCEIILQITNPVVGKPEGHFSHRTNQPVYNQIYRDLARKYSLLLIDNAPAWQKLLEGKGESGFISFVPDGVHPSGEAWAQIVIPNILKTLGL